MVANATKLEYGIDANTGSKVYNVSETDVNGTSKVEAYHWKDPGDLLKVEWIDKKVLLLSPNAQRDNVNVNLVDRIAREFSWKMFQTITVGHRPDGSYWIVDGQHRYLASMKRSDIDKLPCTIIERSSEVDEADTFIGINDNVNPISVLDRHKVKTTANDEIALWINKLFSINGISANQGSTLITTGYRSYTSKGKGTFETAVSLISKCKPEARYSKAVLDGLMYILNHGVVPSMDNFQNTMTKMNHAELADACRKGRLKHRDMPCAEISAVFMLPIINRKKTDKNRITLKVEA